MQGYSTMLPAVAGVLRARRGPCDKEGTHRPVASMSTANRVKSPGASQHAARQSTRSDRGCHRRSDAARLQGAGSELAECGSTAAARGARAAAGAAARGACARQTCHPETPLGARHGHAHVLSRMLLYICEALILIKARDGQHLTEAGFSIYNSLQAFKDSISLTYAAQASQQRFSAR